MGDNWRIDKSVRQAEHDDDADDRRRWATRQGVEFRPLHGRDNEESDPAYKRAEEQDQI
jgi:hypothetical protein